MKNLVALVCVLCVVAAIPVPEPESSKPQSSLDLLQIPLANNKELDILSLTDDNGKISDRNKRTIDVLRQLFPTLTQAANTEDGSVDPNAINEELVQTIRRVREAAAAAEQIEKEKEKAQDKKFEVKVELPSDQDGQASETENKSAPLDELSLDNEADGEDRNKRFLSFGASSGSGSGGGSGNFLFDIVRTSADRVARAVGRVWRVTAGTEPIDSLIPAGSSTSAALVSAAGSNTTTTSSSTNTTSTTFDDDEDDDNLISGSSGTQDSDERANSPDGGAAVHASSDGYTEGIPGPVTRLVVLANRGLSNLIQDLILRIAQTSERVVNFKARLITSLI